MRMGASRGVRLWLIGAMVLIQLLGALFGSGAVAARAAQDSDEDARVEAVTEAVELLGSLEMSSDLHQLYDRLHPDVREVLSRSGLGSFYGSADAVIPAEPVEVERVEFAPYIWPVTGEEYDDAATVTVRVRGDQGDDEVDERRELHLVEDGSSWRWFFGDDEAFVEEQDDRAAADATYESPFADDRYADIDRFWADAFAAAQLDYEAPREIVELEEPVADTGCGVEEDLDDIAIFYCTLDDTMYFNAEFREEVEEGVGPYAWYHIISHEWGHHIQNQLDIDATTDPELDGGLYPIELELQADCLAGVYAQDAFAREEIDSDEVQQAVDITDVAGDVTGTTWDDPAAHGSGRQRRLSTLTGYDDGLLGCNLDLLTAAG